MLRRQWASASKPHKISIRHIVSSQSRPVPETSQATTSSHNPETRLDRGHINDVTHRSERARDKLGQRDFFLDVLNVSATRRDAKQYLARFKSPVEKKPRTSSAVLHERQVETSRRVHEQWQLQSTGVNLGGLYAPTRAIADTPTFVQHVSQEQIYQQARHTAHVALVSIRTPETISNESLGAIALTLSQLVMLDMQIVLTFATAKQHSARLARRSCQEQGERIVRALELHNTSGARYVEGALSITNAPNQSSLTGKLQGAVEVAIPKLIVEPLRRTAISVVPALAYTDSLRIMSVDPSDVMLALTHALSGIASENIRVARPTEAANSLPTIETELDRIIMIDPLGGIPARHRPDGAHVVVNLEQEYDDISRELASVEASPNGSASHHHLQNLEILQSCLSILPPASSALIVSPEEAANSAQSTTFWDSDAVGISTRRQKNPLIHNLLTNKPLISSSLPAARLTSPDPLPSTHQNALATHSTLVKKGMPITIVPDPRLQPWTPPQPGASTISLENNPNINFSRLLALIEDSFRRPLDVQHYLDRIRNRIAGVIIAGEYEGGAILTWETPPNEVSSNQQDPTRLVPYLDKFAVLQRSQGSSGVADMVFQAMVRSCFPSGVCWRSRQDNPVNKWYFERSKGTWQLKDSQWTMFWTTDALVQDKEKWDDYVSVCRNVVPSWADGKKPD